MVQESALISAVGASKTRTLVLACLIPQRMVLCSCYRLLTPFHPPQTRYNCLSMLLFAFFEQFVHVVQN